MKISKTKQELERLFLLWYNDFLTVQEFAAHFHIGYDRARRIIDAGKIINNRHKP